MIGSPLHWGEGGRRPGEGLFWPLPPLTDLAKRLEGDGPRIRTQPIHLPRLAIHAVGFEAGFEAAVADSPYPHADEDFGEIGAADAVLIEEAQHQLVVGGGAVGRTAVDDDSLEQGMTLVPKRLLVHCGETMAQVGGGIPGGGDDGVGFDGDAGEDGGTGADPGPLPYPAMVALRPASNPTRRQRPSLPKPTPPRHHPAPAP